MHLRPRNCFNAGWCTLFVDPEVLEIHQTHVREHRVQAILQKVQTELWIMLLKHKGNSIARLYCTLKSNSGRFNARIQFNFKGMKISKCHLRLRIKAQSEWLIYGRVCIQSLIIILCNSPVIRACWKILCSYSCYTL